ncbi:hypothetical protein FKW77_006917 [Venturia effusa]|uniref:Uncharacterized protein n=1 Tax=Venturia effusa TaxID=50376 RepID=A0A517LN37_9PEZI|nr:hypothetical protein FKW77_006917 [Venturia effusa]
MANNPPVDEDAPRPLVVRAESNLGRVRQASISLVSKFLESDPQPGMWAATGAAIAHAPNLTELRNPVLGGDKIEFDSNGQSAREAPPQQLEREHLERAKTMTINKKTPEDDTFSNEQLQSTYPALHHKCSWLATIKHGLSAFWKFFITPTGFLVTIYGLNVVAWGAMLFFLELKAAPAMNHPDNGDADSSPRKIWLEIDAQILNALFCLTAWGLAPWRFRDFWWLICRRLHIGSDNGITAYHRLVARNEGWYRMTEEEVQHASNETDRFGCQQTFTGERAPPTARWKMDFVVIMMVLNTLLQVGMAYMMWHYNRIDRPAWGAGLFIGLGCAASLFAGLMTWFEGRKIKRIEGPKIISKEISGDESV